MDQDVQLWKKNSLEKPVHEKIASLLSECDASDDRVSSHSKLAQEAIAGWEKAESEAALRKQDLGEELRQTIDERVSFYAELKYRILQLGYAREEQELHDKRVHEAMMKAWKELEKKHEKLEGKYMETSRMVADLRLENSQLTKALQVKEKLINDASEQMSQATREFNILMAKQDVTEKENALLGYELQMLKKELHSRNDELELNRRSADALEKKYSESTNKIRRLESECQSLRVMVRKRLPGPTALAKMKTEVKVQRRVPRGVPDRRIRLMMERACDVEEENKILKEIAGSKDEELCSLRTAFALLNSKLSQVEDQLGDEPERQESVEQIDGSGSWASSLLSKLEDIKHGEIENTAEGRMVAVSDMSLMDCFGEMEKLAIVPVNTPSQDPCDSIGKELVPVKECDSIDLESEDVSTGKSSDWLHNVVKVILEQTRVSKRSINEILEDVRVALKLYIDHLETTTENEASKLLPISGYINWNSSVGMENQLEESELARLQLNLENMQESKRLVEDQLENQKLKNEDLDTQLTVSKVQLHELVQNLSSLEVELEEKRHYCEELEATCLELQVQLESVCSKEVGEDKENHDEELFQNGQEIPADSKKIVVCQESILNLGEQLKALTYSRETPAFDRVLSKSGDKTSTLHASLRDRILAEEGVNFVVDDPNSPETKEIILHSSGPSFREVRTNVPGAVTIITNNKKRGGGLSLLRRLLSRRKKSNNRKKSSLIRGRSL